jgi:hypothetical protein
MPDPDIRTVLTTNGSVRTGLWNCKTQAWESSWGGHVHQRCKYNPEALIPAEQIIPILAVEPGYELRPYEENS